jgi:hypothetical protein
MKTDIRSGAALDAALRLAELHTRQYIPRKKPPGAHSNVYRKYPIY